MKKLLALLAGALLLAGCSAPPIDKDAVYLKLVHENTTNTSSDSELVGMAKNACDALKDGHSMKDLQNVVSRADLTQHQKVEIASIIGYGIGVYCPEEK